jgi:hypothetical protein
MVETQDAIEEDIQAKRAVLARARAQVQLPLGRVFLAELPLKVVRCDGNIKDSRRYGA